MREREREKDVEGENEAEIIGEEKRLNIKADK